MIGWAVTILAGAVVWVLLWFPVHEGLADIHAGFTTLDAALAALGITLLAWAGYSLAGRAWSLPWLLPLLLVLLLVRFAWFGLIQFTGMGYTVEFFIHLEWESVRVAWQEYGRLFRRMLIAMALLVATGLALGRYMRSLSRTAALVCLLVAAVLLAVFREGLPERELYQAWRDWSRPVAVQVDPAVLQRWQESGLVETGLKDKHRISARLPDQPRNLVVLYLESVGVNLADHPDWPDLMPRFAGLLEDHALVDHLHTSSYITIEGLTNTQCGTLFSFHRGSDSLAGGDGLAERLPCLGDVLAEAGYHQVYLGGAGMSFAGKGAFLAAHGFDELKGMEYWREQGLQTRPGKWGLSDAELFEQSLDEIDRLRAGEQPFNITLLTIGTHLPGYFYRECKPYPHGEAGFIQALHCADQLLGQWVDALSERGILDDTVVVITADHHVFPNPEMRALFGDAVDDRRLPFIVLGPDQPEAAVPTGAGYDMPPTVLDLLGIEHDAGFILGRSLMDEPDRPDYLVKRYRDIYQDERVEPAGRCADPDSVDGVSFPLGPCQRQELFAVLDELTRTFSPDMPAIDCARGDNRVSIPTDPDQPVSIFLGGEEQVGRHVWRSREIDPAAPGLFLTELDRAGDIHLRRFLPAAELVGDQVDALMAELPGEAHRWLLAWRPGEPEVAVELSDWQLRLEPEKPSAWLVDPATGEAISVAAPDDAGKQALVIDSAACFEHFEQDPPEP